MNKQLNEIDERILGISQRIDFNSFLTPVNRSEEEDRFFRSLDEGECYNPRFRYKTRNFARERKSLEQMRGLLDPKDDMQRIFLNKIDFMTGQIDLLTRGDAAFTEISGRLYGMPDPGDAKIALGIVSEKKEQEYAFPVETVTPEEMSRVLRNKLEYNGIDWPVVLTDRIISKISISGRTRTVYVNSGLNYTVEEVQRLEVHEVEVHVYRGANGEKQPFNIFREGLAGYNETEEGLAIIAEDVSGCLEIDMRQMKLYAGRHLGVDYSAKGSFCDVFGKLREFFPDYLAYRLTERAKRGLEDTSIKGGFTRDIHYISGSEKMRKYIANGGILSILYVGKVGLGDVDTISRLIRRGELMQPLFLPEFIGEDGKIAKKT